MNIRAGAVGAAIFLLCTAPALAVEPGGYFGISAGMSKYEVDGEAVNREIRDLLGPGSTATTDDSDVGFKAYAGYRLNRNFAVEGGYTNFGEAAFSGANGGVTLEGSIKGYSLNVSALAIFPANETFEFFGRAGAGFWDVEAETTGAGPGGTLSRSQSDSGVSPLLGLGLAINISERIGVRAEWERYFDLGEEDTTTQGDIDLLTVGLTVRF